MPKRKLSEKDKEIQQLREANMLLREENRQIKDGLRQLLRIGER